MLPLAALISLAVRLTASRAKCLAICVLNHLMEGVMLNVSGARPMKAARSLLEFVSESCSNPLVWFPN